MNELLLEMFLFLTDEEKILVAEYLEKIHEEDNHIRNTAPVTADSMWLEEGLQGLSDL